jgi:hypothetical protein
VSGRISCLGVTRASIALIMIAALARRVWEVRIAFAAALAAVHVVEPSFSNSLGCDRKDRLGDRSRDDAESGGRVAGERGFLLSISRHLGGR